MSPWVSQEPQRRIADEVQLPAGYRLEWAGEFGNLQDAVNRLKVIVPAACPPTAVCTAALMSPGASP
jgi:Cu/Ag efflux pump CusA